MLAKALENNVISMLRLAWNLDVNVEVGHQLADSLTLGSNKVAVEFIGQRELFNFGNQSQNISDCELDVVCKTLQCDLVSWIARLLGSNFSGNFVSNFFGGNGINILSIRIFYK